MLSFTFSQNKHLSEIEFFLNHVAELKKFQEVEVSVSFYPYQRQVKADHFRFEPYEDYVADIVEGQRSTYQEIHSIAPQGFGMLLGTAIVSFFLFFQPQLLLSVESMVSVFAAYTVGKEIWSDLDVFLQDHTRLWSVRWVQQSFYYALQQFGTFQRFWQLARKKRFGYQLSLPTEIDFISHSNSKTIEMLFETKDLFAETSQQARILRIIFSLSSSTRFHSEKGLIICRVALVRKFTGVRLVKEYYQAYDQGEIGTLNNQDTWQKNFCLEKRFVMVGRLMWFLSPSKVIKKKILEKK